MELVDGGCLDKMIANGPLDETRTLAIHLEVTEGLNAASQVGLVHGDIKPANILFGKNGEAKVLDFGLASFIGQQTQQSGQVWGTPYYIAPEKVRGKKIDFRSDIYSLGATIFHVLTGQPPFEAPTPMDVVMARLKQPAPNLLTIRPELHPQTAAMVARMMEADPVMRYPSYPALMVDMRDALAASKVPIRKTGAKSVMLKRGGPKLSIIMKRIPWVKVGIGAAVILIVLAGIYGVRARLQKVAAAAAQEEATRLAAVVESGVAFQEIVETIAPKIVGKATSLQSLPQKTDLLAQTVSRGEPSMIELREIADRAQAVLDDVNRDLAIAGQAAQLLIAVTNIPEARLQADRLESLSGEMLRNYEMIEEMTASSVKALAVAGAIERRTLDAQALAQRQADAARAEAAAKKLREEEERKLALAKAQEAERTRPIVTQREMDMLDEALASNAPLILRRQFDDAAKTIAKLKPELTMDESKDYCQALIDTYRGMKTTKAFIVKSIRAKPYRGGLVVGDTPRDIVGVDPDDLGIMVALGASGKLLIPWEKINMQQFLKIAQYYLNVPGASGPEHARAMLGVALFCYQSGLFKPAENGAAAAYREDPSLKDDIDRLMPGLLAEPAP
jgi:hypothetical protein